MQTLVWKCAETGEIFEVEADYLAHVTRLAAEHTVEQKRARLATLRKDVFDSARSVGSLFPRIVAAYNEAISLLVDLGELNAESLERTLVEVRNTEKLVFKGKSPEPRGWLDNSSVTGIVTFVYEGKYLDDEVNDVFDAFPALLGEQRYPAEPTSSVIEGGKLLQAQCVQLLVRDVRRLAAAYSDLNELQPKQRGMRRAIDAKLEELLQADARAVQLRAKIAELTSQLDIEKKALEQVKSRHWQTALHDFDELRRYLKAQELLRMPGQSGQASS